MKTNYKFIHFVEMLKFKTSVYECFNNNSDRTIGIVAWYSAWRQYCFFPETDTVYSLGCLNDIADFMMRLKKPE